jgi:hypothetical protein
MSQTRKENKNRTSLLRKLQTEIDKEVRTKQIDKIASGTHHLLGTKNIPGIYSQRLLPDISSIQYSIPPLIITDATLKTSSGLKSTFKQIGHNPKGVIVKPVINYISKEDLKKYAPGPFLVFCD